MMLKTKHDVCVRKPLNTHTGEMESVRVSGGVALVLHDLAVCWLRLRSICKIAAMRLIVIELTHHIGTFANTLTNTHAHIHTPSLKGLWKTHLTFQFYPNVIL